MAQKSQTLLQLGNNIVSILKTNVRETVLDTKIHCIPIDLDTLTKTLSTVIRTPRVIDNFFDRGPLNSEGSPEQIPEFARLALTLLKDASGLTTKIEASDVQNYKEWQLYMNEQHMKGNLKIPLEQALDIPLNLEQAEPGFPEISIGALRKDISDFVKKQHRSNVYKYNALPKDFVSTLNSSDLEVRKKYLPAVILDDRDEAMAVMYSTFNTTANALYEKLLNKTIKKYLIQANYEKSGTRYSPGFDRGHTILTENGQKIATTPLLEKIDQILFSVNEKLKQQQSSTDKAKLNQLRAQIEKQRVSLLDKSVLGTRIKANLNKDFRKTVASLNANIVLIQDRLENQYDYAQVEGELSRNLAKIAEQLLNGQFSRTLLQEIEYRVNSIFDGKSFQTNVSVNKKLDLRVPGKSKVNVKVNVDRIKRSSNKKPTSRPKITIRETQNTYNLVNLPMLMMQINASLHDQIKKNMGTGSRQDVLNYRTGRFAQSARVERLSESRQGMITAFYSYMKNPYATFSRGGRQERPYTRDPKLLISKSIRELAGTQVANRMRAVLV